jgi:excisionase family DNA binding protein
MNKNFTDGASVDLSNIKDAFLELFQRMSELEVICESITKAEAKDVFSRDDLAQKFGVGLTTIHNAIKNDKLKYFKIGTRTLFHLSDVNNWINGQR